MRFLLAIILVAINSPAVLTGAEPKPFRINHSPERPRSQQVVDIEARFTRAELVGQGGLSVQYQIVEPGRYIERSDPAYRRNWNTLPMKRGDDGVWRTQIPAAAQQHRRLIRYRIGNDHQVVAPGPDDAEPNFAYFVYDGVPDWRAAINPAGGTPDVRNPITFPSALMSSVQVYHFIARQSSIQQTTWYDPSDIWDPRQRHEYKYTGTFVVDGKVYDHVRFRARGGEWRHAMGKNMWKIDFNRGHRLQARDDFGLPYRTKWEKLNLGACIQQGNYQRRGEHGLFEAVTYRLFNLAGVPAPRTHYVHLRIVDSPEENPASQYKGDFWGLYLATEEIDGNFLEEHGLADGNLYKWDFGRPKLEHQADNAPTNGQDIAQFVRSYSRTQPEEWWRENLDLDRYFSYRSILECVHHYDVGSGKNYFYYYHTTARRWIVLPWDVDLTWKDDMYGTGQEPFWRAGVLRQPRFKIEYQNRLREIRDLLFNPEQTGALIEEYASIISNPSGLSFVDADRAKWDYHPIMASRWVSPRKAGQGQFYVESLTQNFRGMVELMKDYISIRGRWCDANLLTAAKVPPTPSIAPDGPLDFKAKELRFTATSRAGQVPAKTLQWRLAEVSTGSAMRPAAPGRYEIEPLWAQTGPSSMSIPRSEMVTGHTYRVRVRGCDADGQCGHWSDAVQFTLPE